MKRSISIAIVAAFCLIAGRPGQAQEMLSLVPSNAEIVVRVDAQAFFQSGMYEIVIGKIGQDKVANILQKVKNMIGVDLVTDIEEVGLFGQIDQDETIVIIVRGQFDEQNLVDLVRANDQYQELDIASHKVHRWVDRKDNKIKHAVFLPGNVLAVAGDRAAMEGLLEVRDTPTKSLLATPSGKALPRDLDKHHAWAILRSTPQTKAEFGKMAAAIELQHLILTADLNEYDIEAQLTVVPARPELADLYLNIAEGAWSTATLLCEEFPQAALAVDTLTVALSPNGKAVEISGMLPNKAVLGIIQKIKARKK